MSTRTTKRRSVNRNARKSTNEIAIKRSAKKRTYQSTDESSSRRGDKRSTRGTTRTTWKSTNNTSWLVGIVVIISLFGLIMVSSASQIIAFSNTNDSLFYFKKQIIYLITGGILCFVFSRIDYNKYKDKTVVYGFYLITMFLLVVVFIIGRSAGGSTRWIDLGFFNLQPSELAKLSTILLTALVISEKKTFKKLEDYSQFLLILIMAALVLLQPDFGTTVLIMAIVLLTLFASGVPLEYFSLFSFSLLITGAVAIFSSKYRTVRFFAFINPEADYRGSGYQIIQSRLALGSGGLTGVGLSMSKQKFSFLPAAYTDFIFAIIGEELGILGTLGVVILFAVFTFVGLGIASACKDRYGKALASAITLSIIIQAGVNLGASVGIFPITGVPLPLISYGGSSLLMTLAALGILINISKSKTVGGFKTE